MTLGHKGRPARLRVACEDGSAVFVPEDERAAEGEAFLAEHGIGYRGQSLSQATNEVFCALIRATRDRPTPAQRRRVVAEQQGLCAMCSAPLECCELDHICPLATQTHCAKQVL